MHRTQLKEALMVNWVMRHHREVRGYHVVHMTDDIVSEAVNHTRHNGMPSYRHLCSSSGPDHVGHLTRTRAYTPGQVLLVVCIFLFFPTCHTTSQVERLLRTYDSVLVVDGHAKLSRSVCQHNHGQRTLHPRSMLNVSAQCTKTPALCSSFCAEHGVHFFLSVRLSLYVSIRRGRC